MYQNKWYYNWGHAYYFKNDGSRATNETLNINNVTYTFDSEGIASSNKASQIVSIATQQLGKPYVWEQQDLTHLIVLDLFNTYINK